MTLVYLMILQAHNEFTLKICPILALNKYKVKYVS